MSELITIQETRVKGTGLASPKNQGGSKENDINLKCNNKYPKPMQVVRLDNGIKSETLSLNKCVKIFGKRLRFNIVKSKYGNRLYYSEHLFCRVRSLGSTGLMCIGNNWTYIVPLRLNYERGTHRTQEGLQYGIYVGMNEYYLDFPPFQLSEEEQKIKAHNRRKRERNARRRLKGEGGIRDTYEFVSLCLDGIPRLVGKAKIAMAAVGGCAVDSVDSTRASISSRMLQSTDAFLETAGEAMTAILIHMENFALLFAGLAADTSLLAAGTRIGLYLRTIGFGSQSILDMVLRSFSNLFPSTSTLRPESGESPIVFQQLRDLYLNWHTIRKSEFIEQMFNLFNYAVLFKLVNDRFVSHDEKGNLCVKIGDVILRRLVPVDIQSDTADVLESMYTGVLYVIERVYLAVVNKDMSLLVEDSKELIALDQEYIDLKLGFENIGNDENLIATPSTRPFCNLGDYISRLEKCIKEFKAQAKVHQKSKYQTIYLNIQSKLLSMGHMLITVLNEMRKKNLKVQPFSVLMYGGTSVGKSYLTTGLITHIGKHCGFKTSGESTKTLNDVDKYQSEVKNDTEVIVLDDLCNGRPSVYTESPLTNVIKIINNIPCAAVKADVSEKGTVYFNARLVVATTNVKDLMASRFSNEPASILRRFSYTVTITVLPDYQVKGSQTLDGAKIDPKNAWYTPAWRYLVEKIEITGVRNGVSAYHYVTILDTIDPIEYYTFMNKAAKVWYEAQEAYVLSVKNPDMGKTNADGIFESLNKPDLHGLTSADIKSTCEFEPHEARDVKQDIQKKLNIRKNKKLAPEFGVSEVYCGSIVALTGLIGLLRFIRPMLCKTVLSADEIEIFEVLRRNFSSVYSRLRAETLIVRSKLDKWSALYNSSVNRCNDANVLVMAKTLEITLQQREILVARYARLFNRLNASHSTDDLREMHSSLRSIRSATDAIIMNSDDRLHMVYLDVLLEVLGEDCVRQCVELRDIPWNDFPTSSLEITEKILARATEIGFDQQHFQAVLQAYVADANNIGATNGELDLTDFRIQDVDASSDSRVVITTVFRDCAYAYTGLPTADPLLDMWWRDNTSAISSVVLERMHDVKLIILSKQLAKKGREKLTDFCELFEQRRVKAFTCAIAAGGLLSYTSYKFLKRSLGTIKESVDLYKLFAERCTDSGSDYELNVPKKDTAYKIIPKIPTRPSHKASTTEHLTFVRKLSDGLAVIYINVYNKLTSTEQVLYSNAVPIQGQVWMIPSHLLDGKYEFKSIRLEFGPDKHLSKTVCNAFDPKDIMAIPDSDFTLIRLNTATNAGWLDLIPEEHGIYDTTGSMLTRDLSTRVLTTGDVLSINYESSIVIETVPPQRYSGFTYTLVNGSIEGYCMSPIYSPTNAIICFHLSGEGTLGRNTIGAGGFVKQSIIREWMHKFPETAYTKSGAFTAPYKADLRLSSEMAMNHVLRERPYDEQLAMVLLGVHGQRLSFRTQYKEHPRCDEILSLLHLDRQHFPPTRDFMKEEGITVHGIWDKDISMIATQKGAFDRISYVLAVEDMMSDWNAIFLSNPPQLCDMGPYADKVTINGCDNVSNITRLDVSTSGGPFQPGPKLKHMFIVDGDDEISHQYEMTDEILSEWDRIDSIMRTNTRINTIFRATIKDEPVKLGKGKMRIFGSCDVAFALQTRRFYLPIIKWLGHNWLKTGVSVGINPNGPDWDELSKYMLEFPNIMAGDYKNYDKTMSSQLMMSSFDALISIASKMRYSASDITCMRVIAHEICYPIYDYDGAYILVDGSNPSGNPLTVIINCVANLILHRYVFKFIYPTLRFSEYVHLQVYGDDNQMSISSEVPDFNYYNFARILAASNIQWTDANKGVIVEGKKYDTLADCAYLKRRFVFHPLLKRWVGAIEKTSLSKMFANYTPTTDDKNWLYSEQILSQNLCTYLREVFMSNPELYMDELQKCTSLTVNNIPYSPPDYMFSTDTMVEYFSKYQGRISYGNSIVLEDINLSSLRPEALIYPCSTYQTTCRNVHNLIHERSSNRSESVSHIYRSTNENNIEKLDTVRSVCVGESKFPSLVSQAGLTHFTDGLTEVLDMGTTIDHTSDLQRDEFDLGAFLARPVRILSGKWSVGTDFNELLYPWNAFLTHPKVADKTRNFRYFKGNVCIKIVINGSKFHFGRIMVFYRPLNVGSNEIEFGLTTDVALNRASQHRNLMLDPCTNKGCEMILPFFYPLDYMNLSAATDATNFGTLRLFSVDELKTASEQSSDVDIQVYAWMKNVQLHVPTSAGLRGESGNDEYSSHPVSHPANIISNIAGKLESVPVIGKYALATKMAADTVGTVARVFGYSRPSILEQPRIIKPIAMGQLATTNTPDTSIKLTVDCKQEVTIDSKVVGLQEEDLLTIESFGKRRSVIHKLTWPVSALQGTRLLSIPLTPNMYWITETVESNVRDFTPAGYIAQFFKYWRAKMCLHFDMVHTSFHSGRLRIVLDTEKTALATSNPETDNVLRSWVIDLSEAGEACIAMPWLGQSNYLELHSNDSQPFALKDSIFAPQFEYDMKRHNGCIHIYVETQLAVPDDTISPDIYMLISVESLDLEYAVPIDLTLGFMKAESGAVIETDSTLHLDSGYKDSLYSTHVFFGEEIKSIRTLLKRYNLAYRTVFNIDTVNDSPSILEIPRSATFKFPILPASDVTDNDNIYLVTDRVKFEAYDSVFTRIKRCFIGYRGGYRYKTILDPTPTSVTGIIQYNTTSSKTSNIIMVSNRFDTDYGVIEAPLLDVSVSGYNTFEPVRGAAGAYVSSTTMGALEYEIPFYTNMRFLPVHHTLMVPDGNQEILDYFRPLVKQTFGVTLSSTSGAPVLHYGAIAEDFNFYYFLCTPTIYTVKQ